MKETKNYFKMNIYNRLRSRKVDIIYNSFGMMASFFSLFFFFIASTTATMGEHVKRTIGWRLQVDLYLFSVWGAVIAFIYFTYKLVMIFKTKENFVAKYFDYVMIGVATLVSIFFIVAQVAVKDSKPLGRSVPSALRSLWEHFLLLPYLVIYFIVYPPKQLTGWKDKLTASYITGAIMALYLFIITFRELPGIRQDGQINFPYNSISPQDVGWAIYMIAIIGLDLGIFGITLATTWLNETILKKHGSISTTIENGKGE